MDGRLRLHFNRVNRGRINIANVSEALSSRWNSSSPKSNNYADPGWAAHGRVWGVATETR